MARASSQGHLRLGTELSGWRVAELVGRGPSCYAYRVQKKRASGSGAESAVLKCLRPELAEDEAWVEHFLSASQVLESLAHPNSLRVLATGQDEATGLAYALLPDMGERSLAWVMHEEGVAGPLVTRIASAVARLMLHCHAAYSPPLLWYAVRPTDVFLPLLQKGEMGIVAGDMSFAKSAMLEPPTGQEIASVPAVECMAPELLDGERATVRSDLYSLGFLVLRLWRGQDAAARSAMRLLGGATVQSLVPGARRPELVAALSGALALDPAERLSDVAAFLAILEGTTPQDALASIGLSSLPWGAGEPPESALQPPPVPQRLRVTSAAPTATRPASAAAEVVEEPAEAELVEEPAPPAEPEPAEAEVVEEPAEAELDEAFAPPAEPEPAEAEVVEEPAEAEVVEAFAPPAEPEPAEAEVVEEPATPVEPEPAEAEVVEEPAVLIEPEREAAEFVEAFAPPDEPEVLPRRQPPPTVVPPAATTPPLRRVRVAGGVGPGAPHPAPPEPVGRLAARARRARVPVERPAASAPAQTLTSATLSEDEARTRATAGRVRPRIPQKGALPPTLASSEAATQPPDPVAPASEPAGLARDLATWTGDEEALLADSTELARVNSATLWEALSAEWESDIAPPPAPPLRRGAEPPSCGDEEHLLEASRGLSHDLACLQYGLAWEDAAALPFGSAGDRTSPPGAVYADCAELDILSQACAEAVRGEEYHSWPPEGLPTGATVPPALAPSPVLEVVALGRRVIEALVDARGRRTPRRGTGRRDRALALTRERPDAAALAAYRTHEVPPALEGHGEDAVGTGGADGREERIALTALRSHEVAVPLADVGAQEEAIAPTGEALGLETRSLRELARGFGRTPEADVHEEDMVHADVGGEQVRYLDAIRRAKVGAPAQAAPEAGTELDIDPLEELLDLLADLEDSIQDAEGDPVMLDAVERWDALGSAARQAADHDSDGRPVVALLFGLLAEHLVARDPQRLGREDARGRAQVVSLLSDAAERLAPQHRSGSEVLP